MELFISYAREDEAFRREFGKHLSVLLRQKLITDWHDRKIVAGQEWSREIDARLESASVIVLLVSPDFVHSEYCWEIELSRALERHRSNEAIVVPVFIRPVYSEGAPFAGLQALPTDAKPVSTWKDHDEAWLDVVRGIRTTIERFRASKSASPGRADQADPLPAHAPAPPVRKATPAPRGTGTGSRYGDVAVLAAQLFRTGEHASPRTAWDEAADQLLPTASLREKSCPRATFLGLCQEGWIRGVPVGEYTKSRENREYARAAVRRIVGDPALADTDPEYLWGVILDGGEKRHNHQMDVVQALWRNQLITTEDQLVRYGHEQPRPVLDWLEDEGERMLAAFKRVFGEAVRPFGNRARRIGGLSDGNEGVQWNVGYDPRDGSCWAGVNLEGMEYVDWPVARLIRRELESPTLPALIRKLGATDPIEVRWKRDYWQAASRPEIEERWIAPTPILASRLTGDQWHNALQEAAGCLGTWTGGRTMRDVTLAKSGVRVTGPVSPHLTIAFPSTKPASWLNFLTEARLRLQPFYDWTIERTE